MQFNFTGIFNDKIKFELWAYNIETVLAEKVETILRRSVFNTRPRDFHDAYILITTQKFDKAVFVEAIDKTIEHRGTVSQINDYMNTLLIIENSDDLKKMWSNYQKQFAYAKNISFEDVCRAVDELISGT